MKHLSWRVGDVMLLATGRGSGEETHGLQTSVERNSCVEVRKEAGDGLGFFYQKISA